MHLRRPERPSVKAVKERVPRRFRFRVKAVLPWTAAVAGGVLSFLGYAGFDLFYLEWVCLVPILWAIRNAGPGQAFLLGWLGGFVGHVGGFYWLLGTIWEFTDFALPTALAGLLALAAANGVIFAVWAWGTRLVTRGLGWSVVWVSPVLWTGIEAFWPEVFPNYLGASQYKLVALTQIAELTGILGPTFLVVYANSVIYAVLERRLSNEAMPRRAAVAFVLTLCAVLGYGSVRIRAVDQRVGAAEKLKVGLIQTNRGARDKAEDPTRFLREHRELTGALTTAHHLDLVVWPESTCTILLPDRRASVPPQVLFEGTRTPLLFGAALIDAEGSRGRGTISAVLADAEGRIVDTYDKMVLVPFGEYLPFEKLFSWLCHEAPSAPQFGPGSNDDPLTFGHHALSVSICYEDIFPGHIRRLMRGGEHRRVPDAMFNLTNDSWYGDTVQPRQHLALASFRAIEHRRALVRATNTGISAIVDPVGRLAQCTGQWTQATLVGEVPLLQGGTVYSILGDWLGWSCAAVGLFGLARTLSRRPSG